MDPPTMGHDLVVPTHPYLDLPDPAEFRRRCRARAVLDLIGIGRESVAPDGLAYRESWRPDTALATWSDGQGHEWSAVFAPEGTYLRGFYHDSPINPLHWQRGRVWDGLLDGLPAALTEYVRNPDVDRTFEYASDPATATPAITLCAWHLPTDSDWQCSAYDEPDDVDEDIEGVEYLFRDVVEWSAEELAESIGDYYGREIDPDAVAAVLGGARLDAALIRAINPDADVAWVQAAVAVTGYPG